MDDRQSGGLDAGPSHDAVHARGRRRALARLAGAVVAASLGPLARATSGSLRIGQSLPLSGPLGAVVRPIVEGQKAMLDELDARGGVLGNRIELITLDDGADPVRTVENTRRLIETEQVVSLFGYAFVPGLVRALPVINEHKVPLIGVYNGADILRRDPQPYLFTTTASIRDEIVQMVRTLAEQQVRHLCVAFQNNEFGRFMAPQVQAIAQEHAVEVALSMPVEPDGSNASAVVAAIAAKAPQAILLLAAGGAAIAVLKAAQGVTRVPVYALSLVGTTALVERLGPAAHGLAVTQVVPNPTRPISPITRDFARAMAKAGLAPTYDRFWGFLNASVLAEVLRRAGGSPTPSGIVAAIERAGSLDVGGYRLSFDATHHHGSHFVDITMIGVDGQFIH